MNQEHLKTSLEVRYLRAKGKAAFGVQVVGMLLVLLAVYNLFLAGTVGTEIWFGYREFLEATTVVGEGQNARFIHVADVVLFGLGAAVVWWA